MGGGQNSAYIISSQLSSFKVNLNCFLVCEMFRSFLLEKDGEEEELQKPVKFKLKQDNAKEILFLTPSQASLPHCYLFNMAQ
jgi:hypothetical protein